MNTISGRARYASKVGRLSRLVSAFASSLKVTALFRPFDVIGGGIVGVELTDLSAETTGTGAGSEVMRYLGTLADMMDINVYVFPGSPRNTEFYKRFGFVPSKRGQFLVRPLPLPEGVRKEIGNEQGYSVTQGG